MKVYARNTNAFTSATCFTPADKDIHRDKIFVADTAAVRVTPVVTDAKRVIHVSHGCFTSPF